MHLTHSGYFLALGDAAGVADVDAQIVDQLAFDQLAEGPFFVQLLAGTQGDIGVRAQGGEGTRVLRADGIFHVEWAEGFDRVAKFDGVWGAQPGMGLEDDLRVVADRLPQCVHITDPLQYGFLRVEMTVGEGIGR